MSTFSAAGCVLFGKRLGCMVGQSENAEIAEFVNAIRTLLRVSEQLVFIPPHIAKTLKLQVWTEHCSAWDTIFRVGKYVVIHFVSNNNYCCKFLSILLVTVQLL